MIVRKLLVIFIVGFAISILATNQVNAQEFRYDTLRLFYSINKTEMEAAGQAKLDSLLSLLNRNKKSTLSITGFADYLGKDPHNVELSEIRANKIKEYMIGKGIDSVRFVNCSGKGALKPATIVPNQKGVPMHRKTEVVVMWPIGKKAVPKTVAKGKEAKVDRSLNPYPAGQSGPSKPKTTAPAKPGDATTSPVPVKPGANSNPASPVAAATAKGPQIAFDKFFFVTGKHLLRPESIVSIKKTAAILNQKPNLKIELHGFVCCDSISPDGIDVDTKTPTLSLNRAKYVFDQLVKQGVDSTRMSYKGFGGKKRAKRV